MTVALNPTDPIEAEEMVKLALWSEDEGEISMTFSELVEELRLNGKPGTGEILEALYRLFDAGQVTRELVAGYYSYSLVPKVVVA
jgi:hypothetical protein